MRGAAVMVLVALAGAAGCKPEPHRQKRAPSPARPLPPEPEPTQPAPEAVPAGSAFVDPAVTTLAIYDLPKARVDPKRALDEVVHGSFGYLRVTTDRDDRKLPLVLVSEPAMADFKPPSLEVLSYFGRGLSKDEVTAVQASEHVLVLSFGGAGADRFKVARDAMKVAAEVARRTGGLVWDESSRELYGAVAWDARMAAWTKPAPLASKLFVIHSYRDGEMVRMVTVGLRKLGLPDLVVNQVSPGETSMAALINLTAQTLVEGGEVGPGGQLAVDTHAVQGDYEVISGGTGRAVLTLAVAERVEGDAENRLWEITFPGSPDLGPQARQSALLASVFGSRDEVIGARDDDAELTAASQRARDKLMAMKATLQPRPPELEHLLVKAPFRTDDGGTEWMWVQVTEWKGSKLSGLLDNDPEQVKGLRAGSRVEVDEDSIFDYIRVHADGSREGNETGEILKRHEHP